MFILSQVDIEIHPVTLNYAQKRITHGVDYIYINLGILLLCTDTQKQYPYRGLHHLSIKWP